MADCFRSTSRACRGKCSLPPIRDARQRPMTLAEKIFARHMLNEKGDVGVRFR